MFDKRYGFFHRLAQRLDKVEKNEFLKITSLLLEERSLWTALADNAPAQIVILRQSEVIYDSTEGLYERLVPFLMETSEPQTFPYPAESNRFLVVQRKSFDRYIFFYISPLSVESSEHMRSGLEALEMLAAGISHEIKNPLTAIDLHTQLLERGITSGKVQASPEIRDYIALVKAENTRLLSVLDTFIGHARKRRPIFSFCEVADILKTLIRIFEVELQERNISVEIDIRPVPKIYSSAEIIQQILADILRNALEAVEEAPHKAIRLSLHEDRSRDGVVLSVEDSGMGISPSLRSRIFEPYYTTKKTGTGLGLTLVLKMAGELGGELSVEEGAHLGGADFRLFLPLSQDQRKLEFLP